MAVSVSALALQRAGRQIGSLPASAIDGRMRLVLATGELEISASGPDSTFSVTIPVSAEEEWEAVVNGSMLTGFLSVLDGEEVGLALASDLHLRAASGEIDLPCVPSDSWHAIGHEPEMDTEWDPGALQQVSRVLHAASTKDPGRSTSGVCFADGKAVATDTYQLAAADLATAFERPLVVPAEALDVVRRLHAGTGSLSLSTSVKSATFQSDHWRFTTNLIVEPFPSWQAFVPKPASPTLITSRTSLLDALRKMRVVAGKAFSNKITIERVDQQQLRVWAQSPDIGRHEERFDGTFGLDRASFDVDRLSRAVDQVRGEEVAIEMAGPRKPAVIRSEGYLAGVMPLRT